MVNVSLHAKTVALSGFTKALTSVTGPHSYSVIRIETDSGTVDVFLHDVEAGRCQAASRAFMQAWNPHNRPEGTR